MPGDGPSAALDVPCRFDLAAWPQAFAEETSHHEESIGRALSQAPHEVGAPLGAERNIDPQGMPALDQVSLKVAADPIDHLEFVLLRGEPALAQKLFGVTHHSLVMRGDDGEKRIGQNKIQ